MSKNFLKWLVVLFLFLPSLALAEIKISGFGFFVDSLKAYNGKNKNELKHTWFILEGSHGNKKVVLILAPSGPPHPVHDLRLHWQKPVRGIDELVVGHFIPPIGREWPDVRIDRLPTIWYGSVADFLVARDDGIRMDTSWRRAKISLGFFSGQGLTGFVDERRSGALHIYPRLRLEILKGFTVGASGRWSRHDRKILATEAVYADTLCKIPAKFSFELIKYPDFYRWYSLGELRVHKKLLLAARFERTEATRRWIPGLVFGLPEDCELKINGVLYSNSATLLSQLVLRF